MPAVAPGFWTDSSQLFRASLRPSQAVAADWYTLPNGDVQPEWLRRLRDFCIATP